MKELVLFGAGYYGRKALYEYGKERIICFVDNSEELQGNTVDGIPIISLTDYKKQWSKYPIVISTLAIREVQKQLELEGINNYSLYIQKPQNYYSADELIENTYKKRREALNESDWNEAIKNESRRDYINQCVDVLAKKVPLFNHIEIETYNRCNGCCDFCPVNTMNDPRPEKKMKDSLFYKIIDNLVDLDYSGKIALFSNNEPFLDDRIFEFHEYARMKLPNARFHLFTNGTKLDLEGFVRIMNSLDELIIDNYNQQLELISPVKKIKEYCEENTELIKKVTIVMRKPKEILTSRGGSAPNRKELITYGKDKCMLPFRQIIIRPDGNVSLCCNDPLGKISLGDLNKNTLEEVWYGELFDSIRKKIVCGRENVSICKYCDTFITT